MDTYDTEEKIIIAYLNGEIDDIDFLDLMEEVNNEIC